MNVTKETENYIHEHPCIKDSLKNGLLNYSKAARLIITDLVLTDKNFHAVLAALRRLEAKLKKTRGFERAIRKILRNTQLEIKNKVLVYIVDKAVPTSQSLLVHENIKSQNLHLQSIEGVNVFTIITSQNAEVILDKCYKHHMISKKRDLVQITLQGPLSLEEVPGVMAYLCSLLAATGINIVETTSCWTDTIFIIHPHDLEKAMQVLSF